MMTPSPDHPPASADPSQSQLSNPFTFNVAGKGFDQGLFQGGGIDDPSTMFRFDTAGHGFGQGVFVN